MLALPLYTEVSGKPDAESVQKREADAQRTQSLSLRTRKLNVKSFGKPVCNTEVQEIQRILKLEAENGHIKFLLPPTAVPHMEKIFSIVRQIYGRSPTDDLNELDKKTAFVVYIYER